MRRYWDSALKKRVDVGKIDKLGTDLLLNFYEFERTYKTLFKICGSLYQIELLSWKLHREILSFEAEADDILLKITSIMNKKKLF